MSLSHYGGKAKGPIYWIHNSLPGGPESFGARLPAEGGEKERDAVTRPFLNCIQVGGSKLNRGLHCPRSSFRLRLYEAEQNRNDFTLYFSDSSCSFTFRSGAAQPASCCIFGCLARLCKKNEKMGKNEQKEELQRGRRRTPVMRKYLMHDRSDLFKNWKCFVVAAERKYLIDDSSRELEQQQNIVLVSPQVTVHSQAI